MINTLRKTTLTVAGIAVLGLGGSALAGAADNNSNSTTTTPSGARPQQQQLSSDVAAKVKAAALDKVPGATVLRTEAGGPYGTAYHAHIKTSDGKLQVVLIDSSFNATAVQADRGPGGRGPGGRPGGPGGGRGETDLTGDTKSKVEAAVLAKYPNATIVRTETNTDGSAPYESHIRTSDGQELEVHVSKDFEVVDSIEHPARP